MTERMKDGMYVNAFNENAEFDRKFHEGRYDKSFFELDADVRDSHFDDYYNKLRWSISNAEKENMIIDDEFKARKDEIEDIKSHILPTLEKRLSKLGSKRKKNNEYIQYLKNYRYRMERDEAQKAYEKEKGRIRRII